MRRKHIIILILTLSFAEVRLISELNVTIQENGNKSLLVESNQTVIESTTIKAQNETLIVNVTEDRTKIPIPKCCPIGEYVLAYNKTCSRPKNSEKRDFTDVPLYNKDTQKTGRFLPDIYYVVPGRFENETFKKAFPFNYERLYHKLYLTEEGVLFQDIPNEYHRRHELNSSMFCADYELPNKFHKELKPGFWTILSPDEEILEENPFITYGLIISSVFLAVVLVVYILLPELRNLGGMVLMAYVASLLGAFVMLAVLKNGRYSKDECNGFSYVTYFLLLASFCWMNVMSCDIWWTFRGYAKARPIHRRGEGCKFLVYCAYAWGLPFAMMIMLIVLNSINMRHIPWFVTPNIPNKSCFMADTAKRFYLYIPMLILILSNWLFFLMTVFNVWRLSRGTAVLDKAAAGTPAAHRKQRARLMVYLKLSIIMGVNWVMEVLSSYKPQLKIWLITDFYNIFIGVSIFLIFVCKKKIFRMLKKRFQELDEPRRRSRYFTSRSSRTTDSDTSQEAPPQVCPNPRGPVYVVKTQYCTKN